jgi:hypothetical protein
MRHRKNLSWVVMIAVVILVLAGCRGNGRNSPGSTVPGSTVPSNPPGVEFDWSMPQRTLPASVDAPITGKYFPSYDNGYGVHDDCCSVRREEIVPKDWPVTLDASASRAAPGRSIKEFGWEIAEEAGLNLISNDSRVTMRFPRLGEYHITLRLTDSAGAKAALTRLVRVKDYLVVGLGDSYSSGEGAPDRPGGSVWNDQRCHRSAQATSARFALLLEQASPHSSVTFIHLACSGAKITEGLLDGYEGIVPDSAERKLDPQVLELENLLHVAPLGYGNIGGRRIDAIVMTIGGNDFGFRNVVLDCLKGPDRCDDQGSGADRILKDAARTIRDRYRLLNQRLEKLYRLGYDEHGEEDTILAPERIFLLEYPVGVKRTTQTGPSVSLNDFCGATHSDLGDGLGPSFLKEEAQWLYETVGGSRLPYYIGQAAITAGWREVSAPNFDGHGYCTRDPWINDLEASKHNQHDIYGMVHPSSRGYATWVNHLWGKLPRLEWRAKGLTVVVNDQPAQGAIVNYVVTAQDPIDGALTPQCDPPSGKYFDLGTYTVKCRAEDWSGEVQEKSYRLDVKETIPPKIDSGKLEHLSNGEVKITASAVTDNGHVASVVAQPWMYLEPPDRARVRPRPKLLGGTLPLNLIPPGTDRSGDWFGTGRLLDPEGQPIPPGEWSVQLVATDTSGNTTTTQLGMYW